MDESRAAQPPAGWYPNPDDPNSERMWDGHQWSDQFRPSTTLVLREAPTAPARPQPPARSRSGWSTGATVGVAIAVFSLLLVGGCGVLLVGTAFLAPGGGEFQETGVERDIGVARAPIPVPTTASSAVGPALSYGSSLEVEWDVGDPTDSSIWELVVDQPIDVTDQILDPGLLGAELGDDTVYAGFWVVLTLQWSPIEPLAPGDGLEWEILGGSTDSVYLAPAADEDVVPCEGVTDLFDANTPIAVGQSIEGFVCVPLSAVDLNQPDTKVVLWFGQGAPVVWGR